MGIKVPGPPPATDDQGGILGTLLDWAARLNNGLNPVNAAQAASKTVPGIVQLATAAQAQAATNDTSVLTPLQALALNKANPFHFPTLAALFADATLPEGSVATVDRYAIGAGYHRESTWHKLNGQWQPVGYSITIEASDRPTALAVSNALTAAITPSTAFIGPGVQTRSANNGIRHLWSGSAWVYDAISGPLQTITGNSSVGTGNTKIADVSQSMSLVAVHYIAPNYDRQDLLFVAQSPYDPTGFAGLISSRQINNTPGYGAPAYNVTSYALYTSISGSGSPSPITSIATSTPLGMN